MDSRVLFGRVVIGPEVPKPLPFVAHIFLMMLILALSLTGTAQGLTINGCSCGTASTSYSCWFANIATNNLVEALNGSAMIAEFCPNLQSIDFQYSLLDALPGLSFSNLPALTYLQLSGNSITSIDLQSFANLTALSTLDIRYNRITTIVSGAFSTLTSLTALSLSGNLLSFVPFGVFSGLPSLRSLTLSSNQLTQISGTAFVDMPSLTAIWLDGNLLTNIAAGTFTVKKLSQITLTSNRISSLEKNAFANATSLTTLSIYDNSLTSLPSNAFYRVSITKLYASRNAITSLPADTFQDMRSMRTLDLSQNKISSIAMNVFEGMNSLTEVDISNNQLPFMPIFTSTKLAKVIIQNNNIKLIPMANAAVLEATPTIVTENNPSICYKAIDPTSEAIRVICKCADRYYGTNYCESIDDNYLLLPQVVSTVAGIHLSHPMLKDGSFSSPFIESTVKPSTNSFSKSFLVPLANNHTVNTTFFGAWSSFPFSIGWDNGVPTGRYEETIASSLNEPLNFARPILVFDKVPVYPMASINETDKAYLASVGVLFFSDHSEFSLSGAPNVSLNGYLLNIYTTDSFTSEVSLAATLTFQVRDCGAYTCQNGGVCVDDGKPYNNNFTCSCPPKFRGKLCEVHDEIPPTITQCPFNVVKVLPTDNSNAEFDSNRDFTFQVSEAGPVGYSLFSPSSSTILPQKFTLEPGRYTILFIARDTANNSASCSFYVTVLKFSLGAALPNNLIAYQAKYTSVRLIDSLLNSSLIFPLDAVDPLQIPSGLALNSQTSSIAGTPLLVQPSKNLVLRICDPSVENRAKVAPSCDFFNVTIKVEPFEAFSSTPNLLPSSAIGSRYSMTLENVYILGGSGCASFRLGSGTLPSGLSLEPATGAISGTPKNQSGVYSFSILVEDSGTSLVAPLNSNATFSLIIQDCDNSTCVNGACVDSVPFDGLYSCQCFPMFSSSTDTGKCTIPADQAPPEIVRCLPSRILMLDSETSEFHLNESAFAGYNVSDNSGSFNVAFSYSSVQDMSNSSIIHTFPVALAVGEYLFTLKATDSSSNSRSCQFYVTVLPALIQPFKTHFKLYQGSPLSIDILGLSGTSVSYSIVDELSTLPLGTYVDSRSGKLVGTPLDSFSSKAVSIRVCDPRDPFVECGHVDFSVEVVSYAVTVNPKSSSKARRSTPTSDFPVATYGVSYSTSAFNVSSAFVTGGSGCLEFHVLGTLPDGLQMSTDGAIQGTPVSFLSGQSSFQILATDSSTVSTLVNNGQYFSILVVDCSDAESCGQNGTCIDTVHNDGVFSCSCATNYAFDSLSQTCILTSEASSGASGSIGASTLGGALGGSLLMFIVALILLYFLVYKRAIKARPHNFESMFSSLDGMVFENDSGPMRPRELPRDAITVLEEIGHGNFGTVSKGIFEEHGRASIRVPGFLVAIKILKDPDATAMRDLMREALTMAQFTHPNVVSLIGVVTIGDPIMLVMEFLENGNLLSYLRKNSIAETLCIKWAVEIASGLCYLVARGFVHRDVATRNVLLDPSLKPKIADFGMSRDTSDDKEYYRSRGGVLPIRWCSPEILDEKKFSQASDVWAYGVLLYEIWTEGATPYKGWSNEKVWIEVTAGYRLPRPEACPAHVYEVMSACWAHKPADRPSFEAIYTLLTGGYSKLNGPDVSVGASLSSENGVHKYVDFTLSDDNANECLEDGNGYLHPHTPASDPTTKPQSMYDDRSKKKKTEGQPGPMPALSDKHPGMAKNPAFPDSMYYDLAEAEALGYMNMDDLARPDGDEIILEGEESNFVLENSTLG